MISITLQMPTGERIYTVPFISGRVMRASYPVQRMIEEIAAGEVAEDAKTLDTMATFICQAFGNQFSVDELYDGYCADDLAATAIDIATAVRAGLTRALEAFPRREAGERPTMGAATATP